MFFCLSAAEHEGLEATEGAEGVTPAAESDISQLNKQGRDWTSIPVGLPFTEMVQPAQNFTVTRLEKSKAGYQETWMQPMQVTRQYYDMETVEVEVTETEMQEMEEEMEETVLESTVVPVVVRE
jgi:hypothetical protein